MTDWMPRFKGDVDGRYVELFECGDGGKLKVVTTPAGDVRSAGSFDPGSETFMRVVPSGAAIEIEASTADGLVRELIAAGFTERGAKEIARHGRRPEPH
ncbi:MAG TPA: hypothetical protein VNT59_06075 [Ramlibacter sp.]|nr:hypothetical protein [Ramlibacter sp.]